MFLANVFVCVWGLFFVCVLTEALLACAAAVAMEETWLMRGEKFVGPDSLS